MSKSIRFEVTDEQHEWLDDIKDKRGYNWKGMMLEGAKCLVSSEPTNDN